MRENVKGFVDIERKGRELRKGRGLFNKEGHAQPVRTTRPATKRGFP